MNYRKPDNCAEDPPKSLDPKVQVQGSKIWKVKKMSFYQVLAEF
jgi:hypothetical protein